MDSFMLGINELTCKSNKLILHHGTKHEMFVPDYKFANPINDYGSGLYTTPDIELAKEWAMSFYTKGEKGFVYSYELNMDGLRVLDLQQYGILYWVATTLKFRTIDNVKGLVKNNLNILTRDYVLPVENFDVIVGWRMDDSYFKFTKDFLRNELSYEMLQEAIRLGELGLQYTLKSEKAFRALSFIEKTDVDKKYIQLFIDRMNRANELYDHLKEIDGGSTFLVDMLR